LADGSCPKSFNLFSFYILIDDSYSYPYIACVFSFRIIASWSLFTITMSAYSKLFLAFFY